MFILGYDSLIIVCHQGLRMDKPHSLKILIPPGMSDTRTEAKITVPRYGGHISFSFFLTTDSFIC